jgi:hypothetical protein
MIAHADGTVTFATETVPHSQSGEAVSPAPSTGSDVMPEPSARITKSPPAEKTMCLPSGDQAGVYRRQPRWASPKIYAERLLLVSSAQSCEGWRPRRRSNTEFSSPPMRRASALRNSHRSRTITPASEP